MALLDKILALTSHFRRKRMRRFVHTFSITDQTEILDVGGEPAFWGDFTPNARITVLNTCVPPLSPRCLLVVADGCRLPFRQECFDIAFSNSVIEHLGSFQNQQRFAGEIRNVAKAIWVQAPARSFPIEPHLWGLCIHWLPKSLQVKLARRLTIWGWLATDYDRDIAVFLKEVRLLTFREMKELFPDCEIKRERWLMMTKSYIAIRRGSG